MTRARLDPRRPLVLDARELGRRPGSLRHVRRTVPAPQDLALELVRVPYGAPLGLDLRLESVVEGVLVSGTVTGPTAGDCGRCLEPFAGELCVDIQELFAYPDSTTDASAGDDEVSRMSGDFLDLEPVLRDAVVLALPLAPVCREDCRGLCPTCGERLDDLPADHSHQALDPRWAALAERFTISEPDTTSSSGPGAGSPAAERPAADSPAAFPAAKSPTTHSPTDSQER